MRRRRFLVLAALLIAVLGVVGTIYAEWHRRHQAALDLALEQAQKNDDLTGIESLVRRRARPRTPKQGEAMLLAAAYAGRVTLARALLTRGAMIAEHDTTEPGEGDGLIDPLVYDYRNEESVLSQAARFPSRIPSGYLALGRYQFRPQGDRLIRRLGITSSEGFELVRLGGPGRGQIRNYFEIGWGLSHVEQPRWQSIYGWDGHRFRLIDGLYPKEFQHWPGELKRLLKEHPEDPEILEYLAYSDRLLGHRAQAKKEFRQAEHAIRAAIKQESDRELRGRLQNMLRQIGQLAAEGASPAKR